jgi:hypothetical protein
MEQQATEALQQAKTVLDAYQEVLRRSCKGDKYGLLSVGNLTHSREEIKEAILLCLGESIRAGRLDAPKEKFFESCYCLLAHFMQEGVIQSIARYQELLDRGGLLNPGEDAELEAGASCAVEAARNLEDEKRRLKKEFDDCRQKLSALNGPNPELNERPGSFCR